MPFEPLIRGEVIRLRADPSLPSDSIPGPIRPNVPHRQVFALLCPSLPKYLGPHVSYNASNWPRCTEFFSLAAFRITRAFISKTLILSMTCLHTFELSVGFSAIIPQVGTPRKLHGMPWCPCLEVIDSG